MVHLPVCAPTSFHKCICLLLPVIGTNCRQQPMDTWSSFHKLRNSSDIERVWQSLNLQEAESHLCLQLIVDRLMKLLISNRVKARQTTATPKSYTLNKREKNAVHYMAGYVAVSLLKRFKKKSKNKHVQLRRDLFVLVLRSMRAEHQPS